MTAHDPRVTLTDLLAAHIRLPLMHSQACTCRWHASLSHPDLHRDHLAEQIEALFDARLAPIRALAEDWAFADGDTGYVRPEVIADLRAALDAASAPVSAQQDHDGAEGQGEGERTGEAHADGCGTCQGLVWCPICEDEREAQRWADEWKKATE